MSLTPKQVELIKSVENEQLLVGRYENPKCINASGGRRGVMSFVFMAKDVTSADLVAVKFMDPENMGNRYAIEAFERESNILQSLSNSPRCLQLVAGKQSYSWKLHPAGSAVGVDIPIDFFVTEWIEYDIDDYFQLQDSLPPEKKLDLFRRILLAVDAVHRKGFYHRDLKVDNIRAKKVGEDEIAVIIDFGLAASTSDAKGGFYARPIGAPAYSPPEAFCGLEGVRALGFHADSYALGALLFQLFNRDLYYSALHATTKYANFELAMAASLMPCQSDDERLREWRRHMVRLKPLVSPPLLTQPGHTVPSSMEYMLTRLYKSLVAWDFDKRLIKLESALRMADAAGRSYENACAQKTDYERKKAERTRRKARIEAKQLRLDAFLESQNA